ncbi:MAG: hypothetical protein LCH54_13800 [Bacteroidetes bacterium]|nr:hypothetical protein [Bacteroidota bacterium]
MSHIFNFILSRNKNIYDWMASDRIVPASLKDVEDKTNILSSSVGTSIPTPMARMYLFKTAFEIVAAQVREGKPADKSIYNGLVSEVLDLLELLYKSGADASKFRYQKWVFDNTQGEDEQIRKFFGKDHGHILLAESFKQACFFDARHPEEANQPFKNKIEITFIYYKEANKEILMGGTSPFTFVFTTPNFKRKLREKSFKPLVGLVSNDILFDSNYTPLQDRDPSFIKYVESLSGSEGISKSFEGFQEYVTNSKKRFENKFSGKSSTLKVIHFDDTPLSVSNISLKHLSAVDYQDTIHETSDFKIVLPEDTHYKFEKSRNPLFLIDKMSYDGQYSSPNSHWNANTRVSENVYVETGLNEIMERDLPGLDGFKYPFLAPFDFFERCLLKLPGYVLNDDRFVSLIQNQPFLLPLKPIFFHFFPIGKVKDYVSIEVKEDQITIILKIPVFGPTKGLRNFICKKIYDATNTITYFGILGIYPFTKAPKNEKNLLFINKYTVASYEKTNEPEKMDSLRFLKQDDFENPLSTTPVTRATYTDINTKTTYYQVNSSFDIIQLNFKKDNSACGGLILPKFKEVQTGTNEFIYAIDFGTSNTHVEYAQFVNGAITETQPFTITGKDGDNSLDFMQMFLLNKPKEVILNDGADHYLDYERSMGFKIDTARKATLREFIPFQIGPQKSASVKFPFRTATCESNAFISNQANNRLFLDANIGFHIDDDTLIDNILYKTNLKWLMESSIADPINKNRISLFFRQLILMIRTKVLLENGDLGKLKLALSFPLSMGESLEGTLKKLFKEQMKDLLNGNEELKEVTESVAPYYQLKFLDINIQNDSFCNIDIGGGTTDIILIDKNPENPNKLTGYCSSFRFAGKQLWGSGSNEFALMENGFVYYYTSFIKRIDENLFNEIQKVLNGKTNRTEDVVGFLFSKKEYKFSEIFSENPELKVVLLIHYSAILYYITRFAKQNKVKLPRTISFSGKGSEYLNLLFPSDNDLKGFTQKILGIFSNETIRNDFEINRSKEPKVITAKGAVHFASENVKVVDNEWAIESSAPHAKEKVLDPIKDTFIGSESDSPTAKNLNYGALNSNSALFSEILKTEVNFLTLLFGNPELCAIINKRLQLQDFSAYKSFFIPENGNIQGEGKIRDSFLATFSTLNLLENIDNSPFFFGLNYSLTKLSREIAENSLKK